MDCGQVPVPKPVALAALERAAPRGSPGARTAPGNCDARGGALPDGARLEGPVSGPPSPQPGGLLGRTFSYPGSVGWTRCGLVYYLAN